MNHHPARSVDWYPWGVFREGNTLDDFRRAYKHVVDLLRGTGAPFK
jgi:hypothetical protein